MTTKHEAIRIHYGWLAVTCVTLDVLAVLIGSGIGLLLRGVL